MGAGPDHELLPSPRNFLLGRKRCVAELFAELFGRSFLLFPHFAVVNHHIVLVARSLALDLAKSDQSSFISQYFASSTSKARNREPFDNSANR